MLFIIPCDSIQCKPISISVYSFIVSPPPPLQDYGFRSSLYPLIISIENHCSQVQQSKMAKIFLALLGTALPSENLVELDAARTRLPSPQELQGNIILKGTHKKEVCIAVS